jgi:hypothetical protein
MSMTYPRLELKTFGLGIWVSMSQNEESVGA